MKLFVADFETTTNLIDNKMLTHVWVWGLSTIAEQNQFECGKTIDEFITKCISITDKEKQIKVYFHNLKFDGEFILYYLFKHGYKHVTEKKEIEENTFTTLISDKNQFYNITLYLKKRGRVWQKIEFIDSLKLIPLKVSQIGKAFGLPIEKDTMDYDAFRYLGYEPTKEELHYLKLDCNIVAQALYIMFRDGHTKMTIGSNALNYFKKEIGKKKFERLFPSIDYDKLIRPAYKGGYVYVNEMWQGKIINKPGMVFDVNSLYPWAMRYKPLPYGQAVVFEGEYVEDKNFPLYIINFNCSFKLKKNKVPTVQKKGSIYYLGTEYLKTSNSELGNIINLSMTNIDFELFLKHYDVHNLEFIGGYKFKAKYGIFDEYIDYWINQKITADAEGNEGMRTLAKLFLNNLYGKFATNPICKPKLPYLENDIVHYNLGNEEERESAYLPMGAFITAWARWKTISTIDKIPFEKFYYCDTDSIHCAWLDENEIDFEIDARKLGAWKHELTFSKAKYIRAKCYIETGYNPSKKQTEKDSKQKVTIAGLPEDCHELVTYENLEEGAIFEGKMRQVHVRGGIKLVETTYKIR